MKLRCRRCVRGVRERSRRRHFEPSLEGCQCLARNERPLNSAATGARQGAVRTADRQHPPTARQLGALSEALRHDLTHPASMRAEPCRTRPGRGASRTLVRFGWMPPRTIRCALIGFLSPGGTTAAGPGASVRHVPRARDRPRRRGGQSAAGQRPYAVPGGRAPVPEPRLDADGPVRLALHRRARGGSLDRLDVAPVLPAVRFSRRCGRSPSARRDRSRG